MARPKKIDDAETVEGEVFEPTAITPLDPEIIAANTPFAEPAQEYSSRAKSFAFKFEAAIVQEDEYTITLEKNGYRLSVNHNQDDDKLEAAFRRGFGA